MVFVQILEIIRIALVGVAFFWGYSVGFANAYDPFSQLHIMIPLVIIAIAGISGLEGLFFSEVSAEAKGYEKGSNYQKQSAFALLSYAFGAVLVYLANWGIHSELSVLFVFLFFFTLSAGNHGLEAIARKNYKWQNINRPFLLLLVLAGFFYPVMMVFKQL